MAAKIEPLLTIEDLDACPDDGNRYELIGGELFVSRAPGIPHQRVLHNLQFAFALYLRKNPIGTLLPGVGAIFSQHDAVIPDLVLVLCEQWDSIATGSALTGAPALAIEILSPGSENRRRDLSVKRQLYAKYGVSEYWVIDAEKRVVEVFRLAASTLEKVETVADEQFITSPLLPGLQLRVSEILIN